MSTHSESSSPAVESKVSTRIFFGLIIGTIIGVFFNLWGENPSRQWILDNITAPLGSSFLQCLLMVVIPLVFSSLIVGIGNLGSIEHLGRLGVRLAIFYFCTVLTATLIGQFLINTIRPGDGLPEETRQAAMAQMQDQVSLLQKQSANVRESLWPGLVTTIIPDNFVGAFAQRNMLGIIFISLIFGIAFLSIENKQNAATLFATLAAVSEGCIKIVEWIMKIAPLAVAALMINAVTHFGLEIMGNVLMYMGVVILGYLIHFFISYGAVVKFLIKIPVVEFYRRLMPIVATAFSTSSSNATMPTSIRTLESNFNVPKEITTFTIPLGATINMDGTALFEVIAALFIAQVFGIELGMSGQITLVILILMTSVGVGGIPGGSIPLLMSSMAAVGIPPEGIALILGVDRLLDMGRTVLNVTGDALAALYLARHEGVDIDSQFLKHKS